MRVPVFSLAPPERRSLSLGSRSNMDGLLTGSGVGASGRLGASLSFRVERSGRASSSDPKRSGKGRPVPDGRSSGVGSVRPSSTGMAVGAAGSRSYWSGSGSEKPRRSRIGSRLRELGTNSAGEAGARLERFCHARGHRHSGEHARAFCATSLGPGTPHRSGRAVATADEIPWRGRFHLRNGMPEKACAATDSDGGFAPCTVALWQYRAPSCLHPMSPTDCVQ